MSTSQKLSQIISHLAGSDTSQYILPTLIQKSSQASGDKSQHILPTLIQKSGQADGDISQHTTTQIIPRSRSMSSSVSAISISSSILLATPLIPKLTLPTEPIPILEKLQDTKRSARGTADDDLSLEEITIDEILTPLSSKSNSDRTINIARQLNSLSNLLETLNVKVVDFGSFSKNPDIWIEITHKTSKLLINPVREKLVKTAVWEFLNNKCKLSLYQHPEGKKTITVTLQAVDLPNFNKLVKVLLITRDV